MKNVYHAIFYSHIVYGIEVWGSACDSHLKAIQILQNRVVRLLTYNDQFPTIPGPLPASSPLFCKLRLLKIKDLFILRVCIFIHTCLFNALLTNFEDWFKFSVNIHNYETRLNFNIASESLTNNLFIPSARTSNYGLKLLKVNGPRIWNSIPVGVRTAMSITTFKSLLKDHLLSKYNELLNIT